MPPVYKVEQSQIVLEQLKELSRQIGTPAARERFVEQLSTLLERLETQPTDIGEPTYHTRKSGGVIYQGVVGPFAVRFALYEHDRLVFLFHVHAVSHPG
jgi:mRNA-degrading endonuclease RelE of RelBE toxin-antitoxin system